ncbi:hypothetical protein SSS_01976 [Sarcoptes scabiei]|uniref:Uncharacterized protein n=1 Tax=Sarcoptes scabiei TaxID=52283 RepID=A0A834R1E2_SARSC|nr:hypothetical protein SSS_01976 [Sarcoptes scabiei]
MTTRITMLLSTHFGFYLKLFTILLCSRLIQSDDSSVYDDHQFNEESHHRSDNDRDHLYSKIDCKVGKKYNYVMATQSSLLNDDKDIVQIKSKLELKCLEKIHWLNETSGQLIPGQVFEAKIITLQPIRLNGTKNKSAKLQMEALFQNLQSLENEEHNSGRKNSKNSTDNRHNIKLGAVNNFFTEMADKLGKWLAEMFDKLVKLIQRWTKRRQDSPISTQCIDDGDGGDHDEFGESKYSWKDFNETDLLSSSSDKRNRNENRREKRRTSKTNLDRFNSEYVELYQRPFKFIQLEDGTIQNIRVSEQDTDPNVIQFKKFLARAFSTQLDDRKKTVLEQSELGEHYCHYQMEYDDDDSVPKHNRDSNVDDDVVIISSDMNDNTNELSRRHNSIRNKNHHQKRHSNWRSVDDDDGDGDGSDLNESKHRLISVMREFKNKDVIERKQSSNYRINSTSNENEGDANILRTKIGLNRLDFNVQEVQLIHGKMIVASGGYFQGFLAQKNLDNRIRKREKLLEISFLDRFIQEHLDLNLQYTMVRIDEDEIRAKRLKRHSDEDEDDSIRMRSEKDESFKMINLAKKISKRFANFEINHSRVKREEREHEQKTDRVVCQKVRKPFRSKTRVLIDGVDDLDNDYVDDNLSSEENQIFSYRLDQNDSNFITNEGSKNRDDDEDQDDYQECYEYKTFGSGILNAYFNRTILTQTKRSSETGKERIENFRTTYRLGAKLLNINMALGRISLEKYQNNARLRMNLFRKNYANLNLCEIQDRPFTQTATIPVYIENIWFITNVAVKLQYKLNLKIDLPGLECKGKSDSRDNSEILDRIINERLEINQLTRLEYGVLVEASFLILSAQMRIKGDFDSNSLLDFKGSCLSARSLVKPMNVSIDFGYKYYHPLCQKWIVDVLAPTPLSWRLSREYQNSWLDNSCL